MHDPSRREVLRLAWTPVLAPLLPASVPASEMRGLWVTRSWMTTPAQVSQVVADARRHGFTAIFAQVRGRGDAFYLGGPDPRSTLLARQPATFDPLADLIGQASRAGLEVHAWVNANLVAGATAVPTQPTHLVVRHPEWLMVPRPIAADLFRQSPADPRYVATLARWSAQHSSTIEGLFVSPLLDGAQDHLVETIDHLTSKYALDGIHLDYIRFPSPDYDHSRAALTAFREALLPELTPAELAALDARAAANPFVFVDDYASRWAAWRRERLTSLVTRVRDAARANRSAIRVTAAVWPDPEDAKQRKLQDWAGWLRGGTIDAVCPMMYVQSLGTFERQLQTLAQLPAGSVWPGIGAFKITAGEAARRVGMARAMGFSGVMLYSYDSMTGGAGRASTYLAALQRQAFTG